MGKPIVYREHQTYSNADCGAMTEEEFKGILQANDVKLCATKDGYMGAPVHLGMNEAFQVSYYVGADWLVEKQLSVVVLPKVENIDFVQMLVGALNVEGKDEADYFAQCYGIEMEQPAIESEAAQNLLTPLLLIHYISLTDRLVRYGLRKDYLTMEENLRGKIKGHLMLQRHWRTNVMTKREDMTYCRYQVFTEDIPVNRLLKRALVFANKMLQEFMSCHESYAAIQCKLNRVMTAFDEVSDEVEVPQVHRMPQNALYRHYTDAVKVARMILRRYDYSLSNISKVYCETPPFWIDMSRLYEMYVLGKLREQYANQILFQVPGDGESMVDYVHTGEKLIIDAKYKPQYASSSIELSDIREISGYARDWKILRAGGMDEDQSEVRCVIVYPAAENNPKVNDMNKSLWERADDISAFRNFKKIGIEVPMV